MKVFVIKQYKETTKEYDIDGIIGVFETRESALEHISDYLPEDVELWKELDNDTKVYTSGIRRITRYIKELETGKILEECRPMKPFVSNNSINL